MSRSSNEILAQLERDGLLKVLGRYELWVKWREGWVMRMSGSLERCTYNAEAITGVPCKIVRDDDEREVVWRNEVAG